MKVIRVFMSIVLFLPGQAVSLVSNVITAFVQIWANKIRSLLTVLGIIIAVTSIITVGNSSAICNASLPQNVKIGKLARSGLRWYVIAYAARDGENAEGDHRRRVVRAA